MDSHLQPHYEKLYLALGRLVHEWAWLESSVNHLLFDLAALHSDQFYKGHGASHVITSVLSNIDVRSCVGIVRALAFTIGDEGRDFFYRLEPTLNLILNELRNKRNRFVHDQWAVIASDRIVRFQQGTRIPKAPASGERTLLLGNQETFSSIDEIAAVAIDVHNARIKLINFSDELQEMYQRKYPDEESQ